MADARDSRIASVGLEGSQPLFRHLHLTVPNASDIPRKPLLSIFSINYLQAVVSRVKQRKIGFTGSFSMYAVLKFQNTAFPKFPTMAMAPISKRQRSGLLNNGNSVSKPALGERPPESFLPLPSGDPTSLRRNRYEKKQSQ
jgi:hypothetical protein